VALQEYLVEYRSQLVLGYNNIRLIIDSTPILPAHPSTFTSINLYFLLVSTPTRFRFSLHSLPLLPLSPFPIPYLLSPFFSFHFCWLPLSSFSALVRFRSDFVLFCSPPPRSDNCKREKKKKQKRVQKRAR
jgi:hypothetical protein